MYKGKPVLIEGFQVTADGNMFVVYMGKGDNSWSSDKWDANVFVEPTLVNGFYNLHYPYKPRLHNAYVYHRTPRRQYRRGLCNDNSQLDSILTHVRSCLGIWLDGAANIEDFGVIENLLAARYPATIEEAVEITKSSGSVAICPEFALTLHVSKPEGILLLNRNNHYIGEVIGTEFKIHFTTMLQEVQDTVYRRRMNVQVSSA